MDDDQSSQHETPEDHSPTTPEGPAGDNPAADPDTLVTVTWRDLSYTVPKHRGDWDMHVQFEYEDGNRARAMFTLLGGGPAGLARVRAEVYSVAKTSADLDECLKHFAEALNKECVGNLP